MPQFKVAIDALILNDLHNRVFRALKDEFDGKVAVSVRGDAVEFTVTAPDPKPTIPELIDAWLAEPTRENGLKLYLALDEHGQTFAHRGCFYYARQGNIAIY